MIIQRNKLRLHLSVPATKSDHKNYLMLHLEKDKLVLEVFCNNEYAQHCYFELGVTEVKHMIKFMWDWVRGKK